MTRPMFRYKLDSQDRIRFVGVNYLEFEKQNRAKKLEQEAVIGRPVWDFIAGKETQHLYELLFAAVREDKRTVSVPFRCDSPTCRRYMLLTIAPGPENELEFSALLVRTEPRPFVALLDSEATRGDDVLIICSWCKRVLVSSGEWREVDSAIADLDLFGTEPLPQLSHGVCVTCASEIESNLKGAT